jgi:hypothetical protein
MWMIILAVLVVVGAVVAVLVVARRRGEPEPEPAPALSPEEQKRKDLEESRDAVAATATAFEAEWEDEQRKKKEEESIEVVGTGMVPSEKAGHKMRLSEQTSDETAKLWADMEKETPVVDEAEKEALAKENRRRKIQSAIQALPYGIPAPALRHIGVDQLASEVVEGATHELPDGTVLVAVRGNWYHGDPEDSSKFLMPYKGAVGGSEGSTSTSSTSEWEEE